MTVQRDVQTVTPAGERLTPLPEGVVPRDLLTQTDERGTVCELYDPRWGVNLDPLVSVYTFTIRPGAAKYRLPLDTTELPVELGPAWHGW